jgi:hypothetical protein
MELSINNVHGKLLDAFRKVKRDVITLRDMSRNQNEKIALLQSNEKSFLIRIKKLETELENLKSEKPKIKVVEKIVKKTVSVPKKRSYVGAKSSMMLHDENCPFAKNIKRENKVLFKSKVKPFKLGYKACSCLK